MYNHLLLALDGSNASFAALAARLLHLASEKDL